MKNRQHLRGYRETDRELQLAILKATIEARVLLRHLRELRRGVKDANRWRTTFNFELYLVEYLNHGMAGNLQQIMRQVNEARRTVLEFLRLNCRD